MMRHASFPRLFLPISFCSLSLPPTLSPSMFLFIYPNVSFSLLSIFHSYNFSIISFSFLPSVFYTPSLSQIPIFFSLPFSLHSFHIFSFCNPCPILSSSFSSHFLHTLSFITIFPRSNPFHPPFLVFFSLSTSIKSSILHPFLPTFLSSILLTFHPSFHPLFFHYSPTPSSIYYQQLAPSF